MQVLLLGPNPKVLKPFQNHDPFQLETN